VRPKSHGCGIKGRYGVKRHAFRMQSVSETAHKRVKIVGFWKRHALAAALGAFGVSRRTLYCRQRAYRALQGRACALDEKGRAPLRRRGRRPWDAGVLERLLQLRAQMPAIGLEKLHVFLLGWCANRAGLLARTCAAALVLAAAVPGKHAGNAARLRHLARACRPFKPRRVSSGSASPFKAGFTKTVLDDAAA